jgi:hypothetical protein
MSDASKIICKAWQSKHPELLLPIMAEEFNWYESPFEAPINDAHTLLSLWKNDLSKQKDIKTNFQVLIDNKLEQVSKVEVNFIRNDNKEINSGVFVIKLNSKGKIIEFRHWWESKQ